MTDENDCLAHEPRGFDPWRFTKTAKARALIDDVIAAVEAKERVDCPRQRSRKANDQETFRATIEAVVCDVAHLHLNRAPDAPQRIAITRSKLHLGHGPQRYRAPALNGQLPKILDLLHATGFIDQKIGDRSMFARVFTDQFGEMRERRRTTIAPGPILVWRMEHHGIAFEDLGHSGAGETIILKEGREDYWHTTLPIDYAETTTTRRYRGELAEINGWLAEADLSLIELHPGELRHVDLSERHVRRVFSRNSFESGGRLFGGFWMSLERRIRLSRLRIDGEHVASLDFSSLNPRLLYAREGIRPPMDDLYRIGGLEAYRHGVKRLLNARLFDVGPRTRKPRRMPEEVRASIELFPRGKTIHELLRLLEATHEPIAHHFGTGVGHGLQFVESSILVEVLLRLKAAGVVALPVHDAIGVRRSQVELARRTMGEVCREIAGEAIPVTVEEIEN